MTNNLVLALIIEQPTRSLDVAKRNRGITVGSRTGRSAARILGIKDGQDPFFPLLSFKMRKVQADFMQWLNGVDKPAALADILGLEIYLQPTDDPAFCQFAVTCYLGAEDDRMISFQGRSQHYPLGKLQAELQKELRQYGEATVILH